MARIVRAVVRYALHDDAPSAAYWRTQPAADCVAAVEVLRAEHHGWTDEARLDFSEFIGCLIAHDVEFLVVGGYAVAAHGHPRCTGDLDVWVVVNPDNASRILAALSDFGFGSGPRGRRRAAGPTSVGCRPWLTSPSATTCACSPTPPPPRRTP